MQELRAFIDNPGKRNESEAPFDDDALQENKIFP